MVRVQRHLPVHSDSSLAVDCQRKKYANDWAQISSVCTLPKPRTVVIQASICLIVNAISININLRICITYIFILSISVFLQLQRKLSLQQNRVSSLRKIHLDIVWIQLWRDEWNSQPETSTKRHDDPITSKHRNLILNHRVLTAVRRSAQKSCR